MKKASSKERQLSAVSTVSEEEVSIPSEVLARTRKDVPPMDRADDLSKSSTRRRKSERRESSIFALVDGSPAVDMPYPDVSSFESKMKQSVGEGSLARDIPRFVPKLFILQEDTVVWPTESTPDQTQLIPCIHCALLELAVITGTTQIDLSMLHKNRVDADNACSEFLEKAKEFDLFCNLLKLSFSQGIVAPLWLWLKMNLLVAYPFKDVPLGWRVEIRADDPEKIVVTHKKQERGYSADPDADSAIHTYNFQWNLEFTLGRSSKKLESFKFWISHLDLNYEILSSAEMNDIKRLTEPFLLAEQTNSPQTNPYRSTSEAWPDDVYLYSGPVHFKVGNNYDTTWIRVRDSTTFLTVFSADPTVDANVKPLAYIDVRDAAIKPKNVGKRIHIEILSQSGMSYKFRFESTEEAMAIVETMDKPSSTPAPSSPAPADLDLPRNLLPTHQRELPSPAPWPIPSCATARAP